MNQNLVVGRMKSLRQQLDDLRGKVVVGRQQLADTKAILRDEFGIRSESQAKEKVAEQVRVLHDLKAKRKALAGEVWMTIRRYENGNI